MHLRFILFSIVFFILTISVSSKERIKNSSINFNFSNDEEEFWDGEDFWDDDFWKEFKSSFNLKIEYPAIEVSTGMTAPQIHKSVFDSNFTHTPFIWFSLGNSEKKKKTKYSYLLEYESEVLQMGYAQSEWFDIEKAKENELKTEWWEFGFRSENGLGYDFGSGFQLVFYNGFIMNWTHLTFPNKNMLDSASGYLNVLNQWDGSTRFGNAFAGGAKLFILDRVGLNAGFERYVIYPRHLFWYWSGSMLIELASHSMLDTFIKRISKSSPAVVPIVGFILKNGLSYGIYELRKKNMNWPFDTTAPFVIDNFNLGITFLF